MGGEEAKGEAQTRVSEAAQSAKQNEKRVIEWKRLSTAKRRGILTALADNEEQKQKGCLWLVALISHIPIQHPVPAPGLWPIRQTTTQEIPQLSWQNCWFRLLLASDDDEKRLVFVSFYLGQIRLPDTILVVAKQRNNDIDRAKI